MKAYCAFVFGASVMFAVVLGVHTFEEGANFEPSYGVLWFLTGVFLTASASGWAMFDD